MKASLFLLSFAMTSAMISSCHTQSISVQDPAKISPKSCASSNGPLPSLSNPDLPSPIHSLNGSLGGGVVQSKDFTIELLLYCDAAFQPDATETNYRSDVGGLAIYYNWRFDAPIQYEKSFSYFGLEPDVQLRLVSYTQGFVAQGQLKGVKFAPHAIPDFSKKSTLRLVYIAGGPFGFAGAALSVDLQPVADGLQPENLLVTALSDSELQSIKSVLPTIAP